MKLTGFVKYDAYRQHKNVESLLSKREEELSKLKKEIKELKEELKSLKKEIEL